MTLEAIRSRLGAIGPTQMNTMGKGARRLLEEDLPKLLEVAKAASEYRTISDKYAGDYKDGCFWVSDQKLVKTRWDTLADALAALEKP